MAKKDLSSLLLALLIVAAITSLGFVMLTGQDDSPDHDHSEHDRAEELLEQIDFREE